MDGLKKHWLVILGLAALIVAGSFWGHWRKTAVPEKPVTVIPAAQPVPEGRAVVYVSGAVNKPGVYKIATDSRAIDAINAAGGLAPGADVNRVNLAQAVRDGLQIHVPLVGAPTTPAATAGEAAKISINAADKGELEKLPGIGPVLAQRIVDYRQANGPFRDIGELKKVTGIGDSKFNHIKDKITL